jgi:uncharacterized protein (TIGR03435 family)
MVRWLTRATIAVTICLFCVQHSPAQVDGTGPVFEVATIKPTDPAFGAILMSLKGGRFSATGFTLKELIAFAYQVDSRQIAGGPKWFDSDRYDVLGKPEREGPLSRDTARILLRALLADRFQVKIHRETREMPVYVLTVEKDGPKMKPRKEGVGGESTGMTFQGAKAFGRNVSAKVLAEELEAMVLDRPVLDRTGLTDNFDFNFSWRPEPDQFGGKGASVPADPNDPDIFTAIREQLGLKLESVKAPAEVIIVDSAIKPTDN